MQRLPLTATLEAYDAQAAALLGGHAGGDPALLRIIHENHPKFLDTDVRWLPLPLSPEEVRAAPLNADDARLALARWYSFRDWTALESLVRAIVSRDPGVYSFELAVEAVISGDEERLATLLADEPELVRARSLRITSHEQAVHGATLLHYVAANGVETYRQKTPPNAVTIARILLDRGADPNALARMYDGDYPTLPMLASSSPPADVGVQTALIETLLAYGADCNGRGTGKWTNPVLTALVFNFAEAAETLVRLGARVDRLVLAAGLGRLPEAAAFLADADPLERHHALALAAQRGHLEIVRLLLDGGEDADRYNPDGMHAHATPLHHAALGGHDAVARLLVERGARLDLRDKLWQSTPAGWAEYGGHKRLAEFLREPQR